METQALSRPLVCLVKHHLAFATSPSKIKVNFRRPLSISQYPFRVLLPSSITNKYHAFPTPHHYKPILSYGPGCPGHPPQRRMLSVSPAAKTAVVTANPRQDEHGNEMLIDITARAANVFSFHSLWPHHPTTANNRPSVLKKSCPRTPTPILLYELRLSPAGAMAFNTSCLLPIPLQYPRKMTPYSSRAIIRGQRWLWTSQVWNC